MSTPLISAPPPHPKSQTLFAPVHGMSTEQYCPRPLLDKDPKPPPRKIKYKNNNTDRVTRQSFESRNSRPTRTYSAAAESAAMEID